MLPIQDGRGGLQESLSGSAPDFSDPTKDIANVHVSVEFVPTEKLGTVEILDKFSKAAGNDFALRFERGNLGFELFDVVHYSIEWTVILVSGLSLAGRNCQLAARTLMPCLTKRFLPAKLKGL
jgi:hypothetical protein